jgi:response regulator RpfG family c-di-GMP phosphodiesterase
MTEKILFVDDEPNILMAFRRQLRTQFDIEVATSGREALDLLSDGLFSVIVSDLRMPVMDGIHFLTQAKAISPDSIRILLTGHADLSTAIDAINQGHIFRFQTKPCTMDVLVDSINAAIKQYHLVTSERELLEKTLSKTVQLMTDMLSLANPIAHGRSIRLRRIVRVISKNMKMSGAWQFELAAMLSQLGCVALPKELLQKVNNGEPLSTKEEKMFASHPMIGYKLLENIPRLESISQMVRDQDRPFSSYAEQPYSYKTVEIDQGAQILKVAIDYDQLIKNGLSHTEAIQNMLPKKVLYDVELVEALTNDEIFHGNWETSFVERISKMGDEL